MLDQANRIAFRLLVFALTLSTSSNTNLYPMIHVYLVFLVSLLTRPAATAMLQDHVPRTHIANFMNALDGSADIKRTARLKDFPQPGHGIPGRPLPEDWVLRGQVYVQCFPTRWFLDANVDDEERLLELASMEELRVLRLRWLGHRIADAGIWISYDEDTDTFSPIPYQGVGESTPTRDEIMVDEEDSFLSPARQDTSFLSAPSRQTTGWSTISDNSSATESSTYIESSDEAMPSTSVRMEDIQYCDEPVQAPTVFTQTPMILKRGKTIQSSGRQETVTPTDSQKVTTEQEKPQRNPYSKEHLSRQSSTVTTIRRSQAVVGMLELL
jgi:hypothetical protein